MSIFCSCTNSIQTSSHTRSVEPKCYISIDVVNSLSLGVYAAESLSVRS